MSPIDTTYVAALGGTSLTPVSGPAAANAEDVARFEAAMANPGEPAAVPTPELSASLFTPEPPPMQPPTLGEAILEGMGMVRNRVENAVDALRGAIESVGPEIHMQDMIAIQMQLAMLTMQQDLMSKILSRSTQNIDQLAKAQ